MRAFYWFLGIALILSSCSGKEELPDTYLSTLLQEVSFKKGNDRYINSPFMTGGDRLYIVGHQDGSFPDLGWHVPGEMGGIWDHPIKLMDGYSIQVRNNGTEEVECLNNASEFINYPVAGKHLFKVEDWGIEISRTQFIPDGMEGIVVELEILNKNEATTSIEVAFTGMVDLSPVWLADSLGIKDEKDNLNWDGEKQVVIARDEGNPWFTIFGSDKPVADHYFVKSECYDNRKGKGMDGTITTQLEIEPNQSRSVKYFISGSYESLNNALATYDSIESGYRKMLTDKISRYNQLKSQTEVNIPDSALSDMFTWIKYNTDWLIRDVEGIGRGVSAGIPDYPWWFGTDNGYTLEGMLATGQFEDVRSTIDLIMELSKQRGEPGQVVHEASSNGFVFNTGNLNTTARFIHLLWKYFEWTGDQEFLEMYYPDAVKGMQWLESKDLDGNMYPDGHGMMEIHGLNSEMVDVVVYTQLAYSALANMAEVLHYPDEAIDYYEKAGMLQEKINSDWWVERDASFADFQASKRKTIELINDAIVRADTLKKPWAVEELKEALARVKALRGNDVQGYVVHHNWVVNTPMEAGLADKEHADKALETARRYTNRFGVFVTGIDRNEEQEESSKWSSFSYVGAVMTLPTGVQAIAECNYGNPDEALNYLKLLHNSFGYAFPGSLYEVSPDYGMISQAWTIYSVAVPVVNHFFGIEPKAYENRVIISPDMPTEWDNVTIEKVRVGSNEVGYEYESFEDLDKYIFKQSDPDWTITLRVPSSDFKEVFVNGDQVEADKQENWVYVNLTGEETTVNLVK